MRYEFIIDGNTAFYHLSEDQVYKMATHFLGGEFQLYRENGDHTLIANGVLTWGALDDCMRWERMRYAA